MSTRTYVEPSTTVNALMASGPEPLVVYGLGIEEIMFLARDYAAQIGPIYKEIVEGTLDESGLMERVIALISDAPTLINMIVFFGWRCQDETEMDVISAMPAGLRIELVDAILRLTFHSENGGGKALGIVAAVFKKVVGQNLPSRKT